MKETYQEFDSHMIIEDLISGGFTKIQSEKLVYAMRATRKIDLSHLATKSDLLELKTDLLKWMYIQMGITIASLGGLITALKIFS